MRPVVTCNLSEGNSTSRNKFGESTDRGSRLRLLRGCLLLVGAASLVLLSRPWLYSDASDTRLAKNSAAQNAPGALTKDGSAKRPVTVADSIQMTLLGNDNQGTPSAQ